MQQYIGILTVGCAAFLAIVMLLSSKPKFAMRLAAVCAVAAAAGGLLLYGYGYIATMDNTPLAVIRTLFAVCRMFIGEADFEDVSGAALFQSRWFAAVFWIVHLLAFYATATTAISAIGAEALRRLRVWMAQWGELHLIYGANGESLEFARALTARNSGVVVFIDDAPELPDPDEISAAGCVLRTDAHALQTDRSFLRSIGVRKGSRKINLYALKKDPCENLAYARRFLSALEETGVASEQTRLVIQAREDSSAGKLQVRPDHYGYGFVSLFQESTLAARLLVRVCPPCNSIRFDENARATEDFEAVVVGFGRMGQEVLKQLVMNGQFAGSTFHAAVFAPGCHSVNGLFTHSLKHVMAQYDITFHDCDARSSQMYEYLSRRGDKIKYIAVCAGSPRINREIAEDFTVCLRDMGIRIPVYQCSHQGVSTFGPDLEDQVTYPLYDPELLSMRSLDAQAMIVNHYYQGQAGGSAVINWMKCDYFSRMSCRAAADFMPAALRAAGRTEEQVLAGDWALTPAQLLTMSETEHLRWCAFHYCMGYSPMTGEEYDAREAEYLRQKAAGQRPAIRVGKNPANRTHACLIPWDALDALSARETAVTGNPTDYKDKDADNVRIIPELLKIQRSFS